MRGLRVPVVAVLLLAMSVGVGACSNMTYQQQRALSGGALGAGAGALIGGLASGSWLAGGLIGAGAGAAIGALTTNRQVHVGN